MNNIQIFNNNEFGQVRVQEQNNQAYFCLADVCKILELEQVSRVKSRLNLYGVTTSKVIDSLGREQEATFINESNLYKCIFQSRKENAEKFTEWVTSEVLPSIRKHGMYATDVTIENMIANPDFAIGLLNKLKEEKEQRIALETKVEEQKPKVLFADCVASCNNSILIRDLAKILNQNGLEIGQNRLFSQLRKDGYLTQKNTPTQKAMDLELFKISEHSHINSFGQNVVTITTRVTGKGQVYFVNKFCKEVCNE